jgi:arylsulfatase A-like enzyme/cytochrome c-type biogenesis protein CcmH/NrfG
LARPFRYTFIQVLVALSACLAAFGGWRFARASAPVNGPIVVMSIDALRADRLPVYGFKGVKTPAIDALAADGVLFERAYANSPQTLPSHVSMLTGRLPFAIGVRDSVGFAVGKSERLLQEMLRDRGFATAGIVSSYLLRKDTGIARGFALFDDDRRQSATTAAERWLDANGNGRAFLFLHVDREPDADYQAHVAAADAALGRLVRYLRSHQLYDRSTIIFLSDHGEGLGERGEQTHGALVGEGALRVPLVVKAPAGEHAGRRVVDPVQLVDLVPTVLDLAKAPIPGNLDGRTLTPLLEGDRFDPRLIYSESLFGTYHFGVTPLQTLTDGRFRYVQGAREELIDLRPSDAGDVDVSGEHPDVLASMRDALRKLAVPEPRQDAAVADAERARLEAAGYVGLRAPGTPLPDIDPSADASDRIRLIEDYRQAVRAAAARQWPEATDRLRALTHQVPDAADLWLHLGRAAARAERHDLALDAYRRALDLEPELVNAQLLAGFELVRLRRSDEAAALAESALALAPADPAVGSRGHELLARVAMVRRDFVGAREEAALAETANPKRPVGAFIDGRIAYEQGRYEAAADAFDAALATVAKSGADLPADFRYYAADTLMRVDRTPEAEYLLVEEVRDYPLNARTRSLLTALYRSTGRADDAAALAAH